MTKLKQLQKHEAMICKGQIFLSKIAICTEQKLSDSSWTANSHHFKPSLAGTEANLT